MPQRVQLLDTNLRCTEVSVAQLSQGVALRRAGHPRAGMYRDMGMTHWLEQAELRPL